MKKNKPDNLGLPREGCLTPIIMADIAIKALKTGDIQKVAYEYGIEVATVQFLQDTLEENAADLFLTITPESTIGFTGIRKSKAIKMPTRSFSC